MKGYDKAYFSSNAHDYRKHFFHPVLQWRFKTIMDRISPTSVLDVGCGGGMMIEMLRKNGIPAYGIDLSPHAIRSMPPHIAKYARTGSILTIPYEAESFDTVISVDVLEHVPQKNAGKAIAECLRVAKRAVYLDITVLEDFLFIHGDPTHVTKLPAETWHSIINETAGGKAIVVRGPSIPFVHQGVFILMKRKR